MGLKDELTENVGQILGDQWQLTDGRVVPETKSIAYGNTGKKITATVLYADIDDSTNMVEDNSPEFCGEVYKSFVRCSAKIIRKQGGEIRSFDGDRVMGVFLGSSPNTSAVKAALMINWSVIYIINPAIKRQYPNLGFEMRHTCGIDTSEMLVVRSGIRNNSDLIWIGSAANIAAKLNSLPSDSPTWITHGVYKKMHESAKFGGNPRRNMWEKRSWTSMSRKTIYRSSFWWALD